eukprot:scaffold20629_cov67-Phaeocystis_antarctica.AAC.7
MECCAGSSFEARYNSTGRASRSGGRITCIPERRHAEVAAVGRVKGSAQSCSRRKRSRLLNTVAARLTSSFATRNACSSNRSPSDVSCGICARSASTASGSRRLPRQPHNRSPAPATCPAAPGPSHGPAYPGMFDRIPGLEAPPLLRPHVVAVKSKQPIATAARWHLFTVASYGPHYGEPTKHVPFFYSTREPEMIRELQKDMQKNCRAYLESIK